MTAEDVAARQEDYPTSRAIDLAVQRTARDLPANVSAVQAGVEQGGAAGYGRAALGAFGIWGDLAPSTTIANQLSELVNIPDTPIGRIGAGDVVMTAAFGRDAARLGYGVIKAGGRTWSRIAQAVAEGVPAERFSQWAQGAGRAVASAGRGLAEEGARQLMDLTPQARVVEQHPMYLSGTPEATVNDIMRKAAAESPDQVAHVSGNEIEAMPGSPFSPNRKAETATPGVKNSGVAPIPLNPGGFPSTDDVRAAVDAGLPHKDWYQQIAQRAVDLVGEENLPEFFTIFGITSAQTKVHDNIAATIQVMKSVREMMAQGKTWPEIRASLLDMGDQVQSTYKKAGVTKEGVPYQKGDGRVDSKGDPAMEYTRRPDIPFVLAGGKKRQAIVDAYETGVSRVESGAKTSSYAGSFESAGQRVYDPRTTNDMWVWRAFNVAPAGEKAAANDDAAYRVVEAVQNEIAAEKGLPGHNIQASLWATMKNLWEQAPDLAREYESGAKSLSEVVEEGAKRKVDVGGKSYPLFDVPTGQAQDFDRPEVQRVLQGVDPSLLRQPGPTEQAASMTRQYSGQGEIPRPSNLPFRLQERAVAEGRAPVAALPVTPADMDAAGLDRQRGIFPWLTIPHRVSEGGGFAVVHLPGGNSDTARYVGSLLGDRLGRPSIVAAPIHGSENLAGVTARGTPEEIQAFSSELQAAGVPHVVGTTGGVLQIPHLGGPPGPLLGTIQEAAGRVGLAPDALALYTGTVSHVAPAEHPGVVQALQDRYRASGPPGLPGRPSGGAGAGPEAAGGVATQAEAGTAPAAPGLISRARSALSANAERVAAADARAGEQGSTVASGTLGALPEPRRVTGDVVPERGLATRPPAAEGTVMQPGQAPPEQAWALHHQVQALDQLIREAPPGSPERARLIMRANETRNELTGHLEDVESRLEDAQNAVSEADRAWFDDPRARAGRTYDEVVGEPQAEVDLLQQERDQYPPSPPAAPTTAADRAAIDAMGGAGEDTTLPAARVINRQPPSAGSTTTYGTFGSVPQPSRGRPTVEMLQEQLTTARQAVDDALQGGDHAAVAQAQDRAAAIESALVDAVNRRRAAEPAIRSDIGQRIEETPPEARGQESLDRLNAARGWDPYSDRSVPPNFDQQALGRYEPTRSISPNVTAGVAPGAAGSDRLGAINQRLGQGLVSSMTGALTGAATDPGSPQGENESDADYAARRARERLQRIAIGGVVGAAGIPLAARGGRALARAVGRGGEELAGGARIGLGDVPPSKVNQVGLPGIEHPPYEKPNIPDVSAEPNAPGNRLGNVPPSQISEPTFPGMEAPYTKPNTPDVSETPNTAQTTAGPERQRVMTELLPSHGLQTTSEIVQSVIRHEQENAARLAREAAKTQAVQEAQTPLSLMRTIRSATEPIVRRLNITRYAGMLSDTATQILNAGSNVVLQGADVAATPIAASLDVARSAMTGSPRQVFFGEVPARLSGMRAGVKVGLQNAAEIMRTGLTPVDAAKQLEGGAAGFASGSGAVDFAMEAPLRALAASDAVFRTSAQGGHLAADGLAAAKQAHPGVKITPDMLSEAMNDPSVIERAGKLAARSVLQESRNVTEAYQAALRKLGPEASAVVSTEIPFVKTPYNVVAQGVGLTPAGLAGVIQDMVEHKPARDIEYRVARVALGTAVMAAAVVDYASGNLTGPRPTDPKELSTLPPGWQPWSRKIQAPAALGGGAYYIPLALLGPFALPPVAAILMGEAAKKGGDPMAQAGRVALGVGQYASQNTMFQSLSNIGGLFDQRDAPRNIERQVEQVAAQFSPHIIGGGALGREIQQIMGMPQRDPQGALDALLATHPLTAGQVEPRQDVIGRPVVPNTPGAIRAVARVGQEQDVSVIRAFRQGRVSLPMAAPKQLNNDTTGQMTTLTSQQQKRWQRVFGQSLQENWSGYGNPRDADTLQRVERDARTAANETILGQR